MLSEKYRGDRQYFESRCNNLRRYVKGCGLVLGGYLLAGLDFKSTLWRVASYPVIHTDPMFTFTYTKRPHLQPLNLELDLGARHVGDVQWYRCPGIEDPKIECGSIVYVLSIFHLLAPSDLAQSVPLDYFNVSAGTATIALGKYKADPALRRGSIFLNPGKISV